MEGSRPYNKTIFTVLREDKVEEVVREYEKICGCLDDPGVGTALASNAVRTGRPGLVKQEFE